MKFFWSSQENDRMKPLFTFLLALLVIAGCAACTLRGAAARPTPLPPSAGKAGLLGQVKISKDLWKSEQVHVYAAAFHGNEAGEGVYVLEPTLDPSATLDGDGYFQLLNLDPGRYVLIVGPTAEKGQGVVNKEGRAQVFSAAVNQNTDLGQVSLTP